MRNSTQHRLVLGYHLASRCRPWAVLLPDLVMDLYSRKIVGWEVHENESAVHASELVQKTVWKEGSID